ncbi:hypothetical protein SUGI_0137300 [Cryptomeria japonica]|nr:hypothetical protein SUGI_0137300 [Cryptomeria japonica]
MHDTSFLATLATHYSIEPYDVFPTSISFVSCSLNVTSYRELQDSERELPFFMHNEPFLISELFCISPEAAALYILPLHKAMANPVKSNELQNLFKCVSDICSQIDEEIDEAVKGIVARYPAHGIKESDVIAAEKAAKKFQEAYDKFAAFCNSRRELYYKQKIERGDAPTF